MMADNSDGNSSFNDTLSLWSYDGEFLDKSHLRPLTPSGYLATAVYLTVLGFVATLGNASVIAVYVRQKKFRCKPHNILILNLAISDLGISIFGYPYCTASGYAGHWLFGDVVCQMYGFMCYTLSLSSLNTLVVIAGFRYISLCYPQYAYRLTHRVTGYSVVGVWLYSLLWSVPPLVGWSSYTYEPFGTSCSIKWRVDTTEEMVYVVGSCICCFLLHLILLSFFYYKIAKRLRKMNVRGQLQVPGVSHRRDFVTSSRMQSENRATFMCFLMVLLFMVAWTPYAISSFWSVCVHELPLAAVTYPTMFAKSSCVFNPIIYAIAHQKFRSLLAQTCCSYLYRRVGLGTTNAYLDQLREDNLRQQNGRIFCVQYTNGNVYIGRKGGWTMESDVAKSSNGESSGQYPFTGLLDTRRISSPGAHGGEELEMHPRGRQYKVQAQIEHFPKTDDDSSAGMDSVKNLSSIEFTVI